MKSKKPLVGKGFGTVAFYNSSTESSTNVGVGMAADRMKGIVLKGGTYYARVSIPKDVQHAFNGLTQKWETLGTSNPFDASKLAPPVIAAIKRKIADVRAGRPITNGSVQGLDEANDKAVDGALIKWGVEFLERAYADLAYDDSSHGDSTPWALTSEIERLRIAAQTGNFEAVPDIDAKFAQMLMVAGASDLITPKFLAEYRRDAADALAMALQAAEHARLLKVAKSRLEAAESGNWRDVGVIPVAATKPLPEPSIRLRALYDKWKATLSVADKEKGRLDHQIRRLIEAVGDKPANHLTRDEIREYIDLVGRFPGRSRSVGLSALPIRELVQKFEADKVAAKVDAQAGILTSKTVFEWFSSYRRMFDWAVEERMIELNPFEGKRLQEFVASKGKAGTKVRQFTDAEIKTIFTAPMFNGFEGDGETGYRETVGTNIIRDAKYWVPILALYHGNRLTEFAALPVADLRLSPAGSWYFDLTDRKVKNESSQRHIPLHPKLVELGFLKYVETVRKSNSPWLFPDLDHENKNGPGHEFSKWWGRWMHKRGLTDPKINLHSWRHTWKRRARETPDMKKELHDVLTGHATTTVSDEYGKGANIEPLVREMAKIVFPEFPVLPVLTA